MTKQAFWGLSIVQGNNDFNSLILSFSHDKIIVRRYNYGKIGKIYRKRRICCV